MSGESSLRAGEIGFDLADGDAERGKHVAHEAVGAAVELRGGDDFVAGFERGEQRVGDGGHAGRGDDGGFGAFERGDFSFGDGERGIAVARVDVGFAFAFGPALHFGGGGEGEGGGAGDGRADRPADAVLIGFAGVDGLGLRAPVLRAGVCFMMQELLVLGAIPASAILAPGGIRLSCSARRSVKSNAQNKNWIRPGY